MTQQRGGPYFRPTMKASIRPTMLAGRVLVICVLLVQNAAAATAVHRVSPRNVVFDDGPSRTEFVLQELVNTFVHTSPPRDRILVCQLGASSDRKPSPDNRWRSLHLIKGGKIDPAWAQVGWGGFVVDGGAIRTECDERGMGLLLYTPEKFGDCQIRVVYRCEKPNANAGVFVRMDDGILAKVGEKSPEVHRNPNGKLSAEMIERLKEASEKHLGGWYPVHHGYEVQILDAGDPWHRTGAIYSLAEAAAVPEGRSEWRTMIITLENERIAVEVDGKQLSSFDASATNQPVRKSWTEPIRELKRPTHGYIGLQNHDPGDVVWFKEISVRTLSGTK